MRRWNRLFPWSLLVAAITLLQLPVLHAADRATGAAPAHWEWCGWGGGGYFWSAAWHPTKPGTIYMGGDCLGMYRTDDYGKHWNVINDGICSYEVYSVAVDRRTPDTVYACGIDGLCKSTDCGEHWQYLAETKKLGIVSQRDGGHGRAASIHAIAVDPINSNTVYAATPSGKIYKSEDGAATWREVYQLSPTEVAPPDALRAEFPAGSAFGAFFFNFTPPADRGSADFQGLGFTIRGNGNAPGGLRLTLWGPNGAVYRSKDLRAVLGKTEWQDVVLAASDFEIDPAQAHDPKKAAAAKSWPKQPDFKTIKRLDFTCSNPTKTSVAYVRNFYFATPGSQKVVIKNFSADKTVNAYGSINMKGPTAGGFSSIAVCPKNPRLLVAASSQAGILMSKDAGATWSMLDTPKAVFSATFAESDPSILFAACHSDGVYKSADGGQTWTKSSQGIDPKSVMRDVAVSPKSADDVICIGSAGWPGRTYYSHDRGKTWIDSSHTVTADYEACPTDVPPPGRPIKKVDISAPTNVAICPSNPQLVFLSAAWRTVLSEDGGKTWNERDRGADISCVTDIRFHRGDAYVTCMDEGLFVSHDNGARWEQLWPHGDPQISGHHWRVQITEDQGALRVMTTCSPWVMNFGNRVVLSRDGGRTHEIITAGLPANRPWEGTMWGQSYARALVVDPNNPQVIYLGIDGEAMGVFKSADGGRTWKRLPKQPDSRTMFYGLAVDPTDSNRIFWAANKTGAGLYRSEDGGQSWQKVLKKESFILNVLVTADGTVYCPGNNLWRSTDHGNTWKQITRQTKGNIIGMEVDPTDPKVIWFSAVSWESPVWGQVMKTSDGGQTWQDITGDCPNRKPTILRFNPVTRELWAGGVGLFKIKQQ